MRVLLVSANREMLPSPVVPLGLLYLASALRARHEVELVDLCFEERPLEHLRTRLAAFAPDVVGLGIRNLHTNTYNEDDTEVVIAWLREVVAAIRAVTEVPVVAGGSGFSLQPETLLGALGCDAGIVGEGERAFPELLARLEQGGRGALPRLVAPWREPGAHRLLTVGRTRRGELNDLPPPDRSLIDPRYLEWDGTDAVQTKRGCAFRCDYCSYPDIEGSKVRVRDPRLVAEEFVSRACAKGVRHLFVVDSVFNVPRSHALEVCRLLADAGAPVPWTCYVTPAGLDDELAVAMRRAGCVGVEIGSDAGTDRMLALMRKPFDTARIRAASASLRRAGIADCHTFVLGTHDETPEEARATLRFVDELDPGVAVFMVYMEDRERRTVARATHRRALLELLAELGARRERWVVPELALRFDVTLMRAVLRTGRAGPGWLHLAARRARGRARSC